MENRPTLPLLHAPPEADWSKNSLGTIVQPKWRTTEKVNKVNTLFTAIRNVQRAVPLAQCSSMKIGGPAKYFVQVSTSEELERAVRAAIDLKIPYVVLGGSSNVLISDTGFDGLVIRNISNEIQFDRSTVTVSSGYNFSRLAVLAAEHGLTGLEFACGIPGTVGGAVFGNAGSFGSEMKDVLQSARVLRQDGTVVTMSTDELQFGYRHSILKERGGIVLAVVIVLQKGEGEAITKLQQKHLAYRREHQPLDWPSLGSVFKNVPLSAFPQEYCKRFRIKEKKFTNVIPAGYINDMLELKGMRIGDAQLSDKHGNYIVNTGHATAEQVLMLISAIKQKVRTGCGGLALHEEIQMVGC